jgi:hypothetical protein
MDVRFNRDDLVIEVDPDSGLGEKIAEINGRYSRHSTITFALSAFVVEFCYPTASIWFAGITVVSSVLTLVVPANFQIEIDEIRFSG